MIARITDRMPAILPRETWATWLGETDAPLSDVKALLRTFEDGGNWTMEPQATKPPRSSIQTAEAEGTGRTVLGRELTLPLGTQ
jgi:putative SOS response-associated peptidase YedK